MQQHMSYDLDALIKALRSRIWPGVPALHALMPLDIVMLPESARETWRKSLAIEFSREHRRDLIASRADNHYPR